MPSYWTFASHLFPNFLAFVFCVNMEKIPYYLGYEANELGKKRLNCLGTKRPS